MTEVRWGYDKHSTAQTNAVLFLCNYIIDKNKRNTIYKDIVCPYFYARIILSSQLIILG